MQQSAVCANTSTSKTALASCAAGMIDVSLVVHCLAQKFGEEDALFIGRERLRVSEAVHGLAARMCQPM